jgi:hypothetical protein
VSRDAGAGSRAVHPWAAGCENSGGDADSAIRQHWKSHHIFRKFEKLPIFDRRNMR